VLAVPSECVDLMSTLPLLYTEQLWHHVEVPLVRAIP